MWRKLLRAVILLLIATATGAVNFCECPCSTASQLVFEPYFQTGANCVRMKNGQSYKNLFLGDNIVDGGHQVYVDQTVYTNPNYRNKPTAYWKLFYPWKNDSNKVVPYVIQNILTLEFLTATTVAQQIDRYVVGKPEINANSLWNFYFGGLKGAYKIENYKLKEWFRQHTERSEGLIKGVVYTDIFFKNDTNSQRFNWFLKACHEQI